MLVIETDSETGKTYIKCHNGDLVEIRVDGDDMYFSEGESNEPNNQDA